MRKPLGIIMVLFLIVTSFCGCSVLQKLGIGNKSSELAHVSSIYIGEEEASLLTDKVPVYLYFANKDNTRLRKLIRYIPATQTKKGSGALATALVEELIKGPAKGTGLNATIPEGTKLVSPVTIEKGTATVDFNSAFVKNHPGGKDAEQMTIFSIVNTLTELVEIQNVIFKIDGETCEEYKGNFRFDAAFPRTTSLISDEEVIKETLSGPEGDSDEADEVINEAGDEDTVVPVIDPEPYIEILE
jgi:germination protein M